MNIFNKSLSLAFLTTTLLYTAPSAITKLDKKNAEQIISMCSDVPLIIKFSAQWCAPCKQMAPLFEECAMNEWKTKYVCLEVDFDQVPEVAKKYDVTVLPTFIVVHNNKMLGKISGMMSKEDLLKRIAEIIHPADLSKLSKKELSERLCTEIMSGSISALKKILDAGADVNAPFENGCPPLLMALFNVQIRPDSIEKITVLLEASASLTITTPGQPEQHVTDFMKQMINNTQSTLERQKTTLLLLEKEQEKRTHKTTTEPQKKEEATRSCKGGVCTIE